MRWLESVGVDGVGIAIASELFALSDDEWELAVRTAVNASALPVVASVGMADGAGAQKRAAQAASLGAAVAMAYPPRGRQLTDSEILKYYAQIAAAAGLPVWVQDAPRLVGVEMSVDVLTKVGAAGYKIEAHPTPPKIAALRAALGPDAVILGGSGGFAFPDELAAGADGTMPGVVQAEVFVSEMKGDARGIHEANRSLLDFMGPRADAFVHMQKVALVARGIFSTTRCRFSPRLLDTDEEREWLQLTM